MTRYLFTHPTAELYGSDRTLLQLVEALGQRTGTGRMVVALPCRGKLATRLEYAGAIVEVGELGAAHRADLSPGRFPRFLQKARAGSRFVEELVERHDIDLVHTNSSVLVGAAKGAHRSKARHVWHIHEILNEPAWAARCMQHLISRWCDLAVANSRATAEAMFGPRFENGAVVYNGVDPGRFVDLDPWAARQSIGVGEDAPLVVLPGRINAWKGQRLLVRAAHLLRKDEAFEHVRYAIVGDPPPGQESYLADLHAEIERHSMSDRIMRIPFTDDLPSLLAAASICVVPSTRPEPFGLVAIEAMAAGTPVIAADHGGLREIVQHGTTGLRFAPGCAKSLADTLERLLGNSIVRDRLGRSAMAAQRQRFTVEQYTKSMFLHYDELVGSRPATERQRAA